MKNYLKHFVAVALLCFSMNAWADADLSNAEASKLYAQKIDIAKSEVVTLKKKLKLEPTSDVLNKELREKQAEIELLKSKKKVVDDAIKAEKQKTKDINAAKKAEQKADQAAHDANNAERNAEAAVEQAYNIIDPEMTLDQASAQYKNLIDLNKNEIKLLKKQKKLEPTNFDIVSKISEKESEIKELQEKKKVVDNAIKANKKSDKAKKAVEKAESNSKKADQKADSSKRNAEQAASRAEEAKQ